MIALAIGASLGLMGSSALGGGTVTYPALGHLRPDAGTIELWYTHPDPGTSIALFKLTLEGDLTCGVGFFRNDENTLRLYASIADRSGSDHLRSLTVNVPVPGPGVHRVALTWRDRAMALYFDGVAMGVRDQSRALFGAPALGSVTVGDAKGRQVIAHALRVSSVARSPDELASAQPVADATTLLLHVYDDDPRGTPVAAPERFTPIVGHAPFVIDGDCTISPGEPPGWAFGTRKEETR